MDDKPLIEPLTSIYEPLLTITNHYSPMIGKSPMLSKHEWLVNHHIMAIYEPLLGSANQY